MKGSVETFIGIIMIAIMVALSTVYISASLNTRHAQNYHSAMVSEIEASHFSDDVIAECIAKAKENGFEKEDGTSGLEVNEVEGLDIAEVRLVYRYSLPILNSILEHEIVGYAR